MRDFAFFFGCDDDALDPVDLSKASDSLKSLCGQNVACLIDGIVLGEDLAASTLAEQAAILAAATASNFRFEPALIVVDTPVEIVVSIDLGAANISHSSFESFALFRLDNSAESSDAPPIAFLEATPATNLFSGVVTVVSHKAGEDIGFMAVAVNSGTEEGGVPLTFTRESAVRSFSALSGVATQAPTASPTLSAPPSVSTMPSLSITPTHSSSPSSHPSAKPTAVPSDMPSEVPTVAPTKRPSRVPTTFPSRSFLPTNLPSHVPTATFKPSHLPSVLPSGTPSAAPYSKSKKKSSKKGYID